MTSRIWIVCVLLLFFGDRISGAEDAPGVASCIGVSPALEDRLIYYNSFDAPLCKPEVNTVNARQVGSVMAGAPGMLGRSAVVGNAAQLQLSSESFSPHRPITVSFWWALQEDHKPDGTFGLFHLANNRGGFVSHFSRGKGTWCALERPAGVLQVHHLPGIPNVNGIYDYDLMARLDLRAGVWHHTALTFSGGEVINLYTDGAPAFRIHLKGRSFSGEDSLHNLVIGNRHAKPMCLDEVLILNRVLMPDDIARYVSAVRSMKEVNYTP